MTLHQLKTGDPQEVTPQQFFDELVPKILEAQKAACTQLGGTYGIQLLGEKGGAWTIDFATASIKEGVEGDQDVYLEMSAKDFITMMKGTLNIEEAALGGRIRFNGDAAKIGNLAAILQPAD